MEPVVIQGERRIMFAIYLGLLPALTQREADLLAAFNSLSLS